MVNIDTLKGKIIEKGMTVETLAHKIGMSEDALYGRFHNNGQNISIREAEDISFALGLTFEEAKNIFFYKMIKNDIDEINIIEEAF